MRASGVSQAWKDDGAVEPHLFILAFTILQIADILTTNQALSLPGRAEINPFMAEAMARLGTAWWVPKLAIIALVISLAFWASRRQSRILTAGFYAALGMTLTVVLSNIAHL